MKILTPKTCPVCSKIYSPTSGVQQRCHDCIQSNLIAGPRPLCACGCGEMVTANSRTRVWNAYVLGHHIRVPGKHPRKKGSEPWNKGNSTRYEFYCALCTKVFHSKLKEAKYCSKECYFQAIRGSGSIWWRGGERASYRAIRRNGKLVRAHRLIMEEIMGRELTPREVIHHIDGNGQNNEIKNLHLFHCDSCHRYHHMTSTPLAYIYAETH